MRKPNNNKERANITSREQLLCLGMLKHKLLQIYFINSLRILYNAFWSSLPPTPTLMPPRRTSASLTLSTFSFWITYGLQVGLPTFSWMSACLLEHAQLTRDHILGKNWLSSPEVVKCLQLLSQRRELRAPSPSVIEHWLGWSYRVLSWAASAAEDPWNAVVFPAQKTSFCRTETNFGSMATWGTTTPYSLLMIL